MFGKFVFAYDLISGFSVSNWAIGSNISSLAQDKKENEMIIRYKIGLKKFMNLN